MVKSALLRPPDHVYKETIIVLKKELRSLKIYITSFCFTQVWLKHEPISTAYDRGKYRLKNRDYSYEMRGYELFDGILVLPFSCQ